MAQSPDFPNFKIRPVSAATLRQIDSGELAFRPGFWDGPGAAVESGVATFLGAFSGEQAVGYLGILGFTAGTLSPETTEGLKGLLRTERSKRFLGTAALETEPDDTTIVAQNLAFALAAPKGKGIGTALFEAALDRIAKSASTTSPVPVFLSVAAGNQSRRLYEERLGFVPLYFEGNELTKPGPYLPPPSPDGSFGPLETRDYLYMGVVLAGPQQSSPE